MAKRIHSVSSSTTSVGIPRASISPRTLHFAGRQILFECQKARVHNIIRSTRNHYDQQMVMDPKVQKMTNRHLRTITQGIPLIGDEAISYKRLHVGVAWALHCRALRGM